MNQGDRIFPTKTIRVLSLAPNLNTRSNGEAEDMETSAPPPVNEDAHAAILEIMDMLSDEASSDTDTDAEESETDIRFV